MSTFFRPDYLRTFFGFLLVFLVVFLGYSFLYAYIALDVAIDDFPSYVSLLSSVWMIKIAQGVGICALGSGVTVYSHRCIIDERGVYGKNTMGVIVLAEWDNIESVTPFRVPFIPVLRIKLKCGRWSLWVTKKALKNRKFHARVNQLEHSAE